MLNWLNRLRKPKVLPESPAVDLFVPVEVKLMDIEVLQEKIAHMHEVINNLNNANTDDQTIIQTMDQMIIDLKNEVSSVKGELTGYKKFHECMYRNRSKIEALFDEAELEMNRE